MLQACGTRIEQLSMKKGIFTTERAVEDARSKTSPLHGGFTWDDKEAAAAYRLKEAEQLIDSLLTVDKK
jgi:hypothetical protein